MADEEKLNDLLVLSSTELNAISLNTEKIKNIEKDIQILELKNQLLAVQDTLLDAQKEVIKRDRMILEYHNIKVNQLLKDTKNRSKEELIEISKQYEGLEGKKWGYNPDTGEILIDEKLQTTP